MRPWAALSSLLWRGSAPAAAAAAAPLLPTAPPLPTDRRVARLQRALLAYLRRLDAGSGPGFALEQCPSTIPGAGDGVFLRGGRVAPGAVLTLYPGLVTPVEDVLRAMQASGPEEALSPIPPCWAIRNSYLLQLSHGRSTFFIDGRPAGESGRRFAAAAAAAAGTAPINAAWLASSGGGGGAGQHEALLRQAALGHKLNHRSGPGADASFELAPLPAAALPPRLARFIPSLPTGSACGGGVRWVPLAVACRALAAPPDEESSAALPELFVDYGHDPQSIGWRP